MRSSTILSVTRAIGEPTRLRILALLMERELTVKDLAAILGQSQPRISRHLKLLADAGLIQRFRDGSWVYLSLGEGTDAVALARRVLERLDPDDPVSVRDRGRVERVEQERMAHAQDYFARHAGEWDRLRSLHVAEGEVEAAIRAMLQGRRFATLVDLGTGTGRMLELLADQYGQGLGFDINQAMLSAARAALERARLTHARVRHGDLMEIALPSGHADCVVIHQVLHYLADPSPALREAGRVLMPGGWLLIVDFAPHDLEFLRNEHAHARLGLADAQVRQWLADTSLRLVATRELMSAAGSDNQRLTVTMWLAEKQPPRSGGVRAERPTKRKSSLEHSR